MPVKPDLLRGDPGRFHACEVAQLQPSEKGVDVGGKAVGFDPAVI